MAVFRVERNKGYTVMSNYHLKDKQLTLKSKGLLSMMLSLPDEWNYSTRGLAAICKEGVDAIGAALKELEKTGYIIRNRLRGERGRIVDTEYVIYEKPQDKPEHPNPQTPNTSGFLPHTAFPYMVNPDMDNPDTGEPDTENPAQLNIYNNKSTDKSNNDLSNIHQSIRPPPKDGQTDETDAYRSLLMENISYDSLLGQYGRERVNEIVEVLLDAVCTTKPYLRVDGENKPVEVVKSRLLKIDSSHIEYCFERLDLNTTKVRNIKSYLLTTLYNAPATIDHYYRAEVQHDMHGGP